MTEDDVNPLDPGKQGWRLALAAADAAPRCRAHSRRTREPCRAPAFTGWRVCRVQGAGGGHRAGSTHPSWKYGLRSESWISMRRLASELAREAREVAALVG